jgi:hypothetical protein
VNVLDLFGSPSDVLSNICLWCLKAALNVVTYKLTAVLRDTSISVDAIDPRRIEHRYEWLRGFSQGRITRIIWAARLPDNGQAQVFL